MRHPVLGLDKLVEEDGSKAFYDSKDLEQDTSGYGVRFLLPNLYSDYFKNKDDYHKEVGKVEK